MTDIFFRADDDVLDFILTLITYLTLDFTLTSTCPRTHRTCFMQHSRSWRMYTHYNTVGLMFVLCQLWNGASIILENFSAGLCFKKGDAAGANGHDLSL